MSSTPVSTPIMPIIGGSSPLTTEAAVVDYGQLGGGGYSFTGVDITSLGGLSSKFTLATAVFDISGSTSGFEKSLEEALTSIVTACQLDANQASMLLRVLLFNGQITELHGFLPVQSINPLDYAGKIVSGGTTALFDATMNALSASVAYAEQLAQSMYMSNAITFVATDGEDYPGSVATPAGIRKEMTRIVQAETGLESVNLILIGIGNPKVQQYLDRFRKEAQITQFEHMGDLAGMTTKERARRFAQMASFVTGNISSSSQALGTGGPSKALSFS